MKEMTINELRKSGYELDDEILRAIYENPMVRDLPRTAGLHGFLSRFVVAQSSIYFVYGMDESLVFGEFVEARETIFPISRVKRYGFFDPNQDCGTMMSPRCMVEKIPLNIDVIYANMELLETLCRTYKKHNFTMPEYITLDADTEHKLQSFRDVADNPEIVQNHAKQSFQLREWQYLYDLAIWEWPIRPDGKKPGFGAFASHSRYSPRLQNLRKMERLYNKPKKWDKMFRSEQCYGTAMLRDFFDEKELDFVCQGLDQMGIPYIKNFVDKKVAKAAMAEKTWYQSFFNNDRYTKHANAKTLYMSRLDLGAFLYWKIQYLETLFTDEEKKYGARLVHDSFDLYENQIVPATYTFEVPCTSLNLFRDFAKMNQIHFGFMGTEAVKNELRLPLIASYEHMPAIVDYLHMEKDSLATLHTSSVVGAPYERRSFTKDEEGVFITERTWSGEFGASMRHSLNSVRGIIKPK